MTREDIDRIALEYFGDKESEHEMDEVFDLAKKALEQEPCEDAISRQAVLDQAVDYGSNTYLIPVNSVKTLPSVTPKEKTGKWIRWYETIEQEHCTIHDPHCKCSECNQEYDPYIASLFNYCPNCGCRISHKGASDWEIGGKTLAELSDFFGQEVVRVGDRIKFKN